MDSSINYRHAETHYAELRSRAELHRRAAKVRETRERRSSRAAIRRIPHPGAAVLALLSRPGRVARRA